MTTLERKANLGQVWTPEYIAIKMAQNLSLHLNENSKILDPANGPATFSKALKIASSRNFHLTCYDVDKRFSKLTEKVNKELQIESIVNNQDYLLDKSLTCSFDGAILNPPYLRHEKLKNKNEYANYLEKIYSEKIDRRSNIFAYFMLKVINDLKVNGVMCAIVYDAIKETAYGRKTLTLLNNHAELISLEHVKAPFDDVLVDASVFLFKKRKEPIVKRSTQSTEDGSFVFLHQLMDTKRGTCFIKRDIFLADKNDPYFELSSPLFIKQANLKGFEIKPDNNAYIFEKDEVPSDFLNWIEKRAVANGKRGCKLTNKKVSLPIIFNYYIRNNPRHLFNPNNVNVSDNFYASYPKNNFPSEVAWLLLNSDLYLNKILKEGRNQGNGLIKLQLFEYKNAQLPDWGLLSEQQVDEIYKVAVNLLKNKDKREKVVDTANSITRKYFNDFYPKEFASIND